MQPTATEINLFCLCIWLSPNTAILRLSVVRREDHRLQASHDQRWLDDRLCQHQPPLIRCQMSPRWPSGSRENISADSWEPITNQRNYVWSSSASPTLADKSLSALFVWLCWLLSASQFLFGCKFKCLTLAGIIVACHGRASDPSLTWSLSHQPGQGTSVWEPGSLHQTADNEMLRLTTNEILRVCYILCQSQSFPKLL